MARRQCCPAGLPRSCGVWPRPDHDAADRLCIHSVGLCGGHGVAGIAAPQPRIAIVDEDTRSSQSASLMRSSRPTSFATSADEQARMDERMDCRARTPSPLADSHRLPARCLAAVRGGSAQCGTATRVSQASPQWLCAVDSGNRGDQTFAQPHAGALFAGGGNVVYACASTPQRHPRTWFGA